MDKIYSGDILNITPFSRGFVFATRETNKAGKPVARFYGFDATNRSFARIKKNIYQKIKFGYCYEDITARLEDYISCDCGFLNDGKIMVVYPNGNYIIYNSNGVENISSGLSYRDNAACDIATGDDYIWSAVPADNSIIKFSPKEGRIVMRIGGAENTEFACPTSVTLSGGRLFVCNKANNTISQVDVKTGKIKDYRVFKEKVIKYIAVQSMEFVWLESGLYILD